MFNEWHGLIEANEMVTLMFGCNGKEAQTLKELFCGHVFASGAMKFSLSNQWSYSHILSGQPPNSWIGCMDIALTRVTPFPYSAMGVR